MSLDLMTIVTPDEAMPMEIRHPATGEILLDPETKEPVTIRIRSRDSEQYAAVMHGQQNRRIAEAQKSRRSKMASEQVEAEAVELVVACTAGWSGFTYAGEDPFPFSPANARRLYTEVKAIREQAESFIMDRANFFRDSKTSS